jgi:rhodanese-related sulfurtransferase
MVKQVVLALLFLSVLAVSLPARAEDAARFMTKEQLRPMLGSPGIVVIDVRTKYDWDTSKVKIPGAVREEGIKFGSWMNKYPKDKTIVIYCA